MCWSERDGWGHYYVYDATTGTLKNRITDGEFVSMSIDAVDDKTQDAVHQRGRPREG